MASMQPITPPLAIALTEGDHPILLEAREAGRSENGLRATVIAKNGAMIHSAVIHFADSEGRRTFVQTCLANLGEDRYAVDVFDAGFVQLNDAVERFLRSPGEDDEGASRTSEAQRILELITDVDCFHTAAGAPYIHFFLNGHHEVASLGGGESRFMAWVRTTLFDATGRPPSSKGISEAMAMWEARAMMAEPAVEVAVRVGSHGGCIYLDLGDEHWRAVEIDGEGWRVRDDPPVRFLRGSGMQPLPVPERGGTMEELRPFINVGGEDDWRQLVGWLVMTLNPDGPYPQLALHGERGSGKSTATRMVARLIDPRKPAARAQPRSEQDIAVAARNGHILAYDNLSAIPLWLSDALCRLATGAGFGTRKLYSNDEEQIFDARRPVIYNGIGELATQGDLLDRAVVVGLPTMPRLRDERGMEKEFATAYPRILGALCDAASAALRNLDETHIEDPPRMADFARWVTAAEPALSWEAGSFLRSYTRGREDAVRVELEAAPIYKPLRMLLDREPEWRGTAADLLQALTPLAVTDAWQRGWPKAANTLSVELRKLKPTLRLVGIAVVLDERGGRKGERIITIRQTTADDC